MQQLPNDIQIYINRLIHKEWIKKIEMEYHLRYRLSVRQTLISPNTYFYLANYREINDDTYHDCLIRTLEHQRTSARLPKRYIFSSGMNNIQSFKNEFPE